ncbi:MAG TPA: FAD binding domain-containing protein [Candidatus Angelobacter sp.]|jgi:carbon-monoxide dehydrogenase medium subunit|nr:FAD binding domain-containing protein [Candidatus Angelobacter sp.]
MIPGAFEYVRASSAEEAASLLSQHGEDAKLIAGGQSLVPLMRLRLSQPSVLVDIGRMRDCSHIRRDNGTLVVGALARHVDIHGSDEVRAALPLLADMAYEVGDSQVRNLGTMGGVVAHGDPAGDYNALALMLDAQIVTTRGTHRAAGFYRDLFTTALQPDEVVVEVRFPVATGAHAYQKFRRRLYDWALAGVAVQRVDGDVRVGFVNLAPTPRRGAAVERALAGGASSADAAAQVAQDIAPTSDVRGSAAYKTHLTEVLTARALQAVA